MINVKVDVSGLDKFQKYIDSLNNIYANMLKIKFDIIVKSDSDTIQMICNINVSDMNLNQYLGEKSLAELKEVINKRYNLSRGETFNEYLNNNILNVDDNGFKISNGTFVETGQYPFNIALAFEYGMGIIGQENPKESAWEYNVNMHQSRWSYYNQILNEIGFTKGYQGMEIFRYAKEEIIKNLPNWIKEYYERGVK